MGEPLPAPHPPRPAACTVRARAGRRRSTSPPTAPHGPRGGHLDLEAVVVSFFKLDLGPELDRQPDRERLARTEGGHDGLRVVKHLRLADRVGQHARAPADRRLAVVLEERRDRVGREPLLPDRADDERVGRGALLEAVDDGARLGLAHQPVEHLARRLTRDRERDRRLCRVSLALDRDRRVRHHGHHAERGVRRGRGARDA